MVAIVAPGPFDRPRFRPLGFRSDFGAPRAARPTTAASGGSVSSAPPAL
jgi:hypothetical protein